MQVNYKILTIPSVFIGVAEIPSPMVESLNSYLDELLQDEGRLSRGDSLVGQIRHGEQLGLDPAHPTIDEFVLLLRKLSAEYITHFSQKTGQHFNKNRLIELESIWSVHSYAGDYNPLHDHATKAIMGISTTCWTKVPPQIGDRRVGKGSITGDLLDASGAHDGYLVFEFGRCDTMNTERLMPSQSIAVCPEVGKLLLFPSWLQHMVYPFFGDGERRTIAANFNGWETDGNRIKVSKIG